ncbi:hypothetical protein C3B47_14320 [Flavobacterium columnare]|uniref:nucleoid-associated protein n=1 Tax=Flavobacterium columnare TaxID=996 RepID=UPI001896732F|nr:nucleoid-associated protein [Flavobacterium columnare]MBF6654029.1 hypothetical protein [Flavobacterium columnare]MBF6655054.1 hypothetical protein [Flavobacterium columnare]
MKINNIVLHRIDKELKEKSSLTYSDKLMPIDDTVIEFVKILLRIYSSKNPSQGTFEDDITNYPFQNKVETYIKDGDFLKFTQDAMLLLQNRIDISTTTGGYVLFVHYEEKDIDFIISAMMDKSAQYTNTDDLGIQKLMTLNVEKLARANRLNIDKWKRRDGRYLTFIKGTRDVSQYFIKFIGATDISSAKENFKTLKDSIKQYSNSNKLSLTKQDEIRESLSNYFTKCFNEKKDVEIESVSSLINPDEPSSFLGFIKEKEIEISGKIGIHTKKDFENFTRNKLIEDGYTFVFEKELVKKGKISREGDSIIIHNIPKDKLDLIFENESEIKDE